MSTVALDVAAVRARFSALDTPTAFLDGPGGTHANLGGPFERVGGPTR
jgi:hypothetical protein